MPELPEVETVRKTLQELITGKTIDHVWVGWPRMIKNPDDAEAFKVMLKGETVETVQRKGKFLKVILDSKVLVSHLRMEGKYALHKPGSEPTKHTHVILTFTDGTALHYADVRKFGTMHLFSKGEEENHPPLSKLGPEPVGSQAIEPDELKRRLLRTTRAVKAALLDQSVMTGLGNIYVDEALFQAGIHPATLANALTGDDVSRLHQAVQKTLLEAIAQGGTSIRSYVNGRGEMGYFQQQLYVYGRAGEPCRLCNEEIIRSVVAGRGTHTCNQCQPYKTNREDDQR